MHLFGTIYLGLNLFSQKVALTAFSIILTYFLVSGKDEEKENLDQTQPLEKKASKTSRNQGKYHNMEKSSPRSKSEIGSSFQQKPPNQSLQTAQEERGQEMNLMEMTSVLKDLQSLSTALLTMDKEASEDSQLSL